MADVPTVVQAVTQVMRDVRAVAKTDRNAHAGFSFRGIDAVVNAVGPALRAHGVVVVPHQVSVEREPVTVGQKQTRMQSCQVEVVYRWYGPACDFFDTHVVAEAMDSGDKATSKAMSVALRTCLLQTLCLPTDEPDPDHDVYERTAPADGELEQLIGKLEAAGVEGNWASTRKYASQSPQKMAATLSKLSKLLADADA